MNISVMIDFVIAAVVIFFALLGWKRGLVRSLTELLAMSAALFLANQIAAATAPKLVDNYLRPVVYSAIENRIALLAAEPGTRVVSQDTLEGVLDGIPYVGDQVKGMMADKIFSAQDRLVEDGLAMVQSTAKDMADKALNGVVCDMVRSLICSVCFVVLTFVLRLIARVLNFAAKLPGIKQLNKAGGMLLGAAKGLLLVGVGVWVLRLTGVITPEAAEQSVLIGLFSLWMSGL